MQAQDAQITLGNGSVVAVHGASASIQKKGAGAKIFVRAGGSFPVAWVSASHPTLPSRTETIRKTGWYMYAPFTHVFMERTKIAQHEKYSHPEGV